MQKLWLILFFTFSCSVLSNGQEYLLKNNVKLDRIEYGLDCMYNYEFDKADSIFHIVKNENPGHPVGPFLEGLSVYWKNAPLNLSDNKAVNTFFSKMEKSSELADEMVKKNKDNLEGSFFSLVSHAMQMMYYADNNKIGKVIKHIPYSYSRVVKAFELKDNFEEYKFFTGLYNYYIEAYPDAHPAYKPLMIFLHDGNLETGLKELNWIADSSVFMKAEGLFFLHHIYLSYECNPEMALKYAKRLHKLYPDNTFYLTHLIYNLFVLSEYEKAGRLIPLLVEKNGSNDFENMMITIFRGMKEELVNKNDELSEKLYKKGIKMADKFIPRVDTYISLAYIGLSRIYSIRGMTGLAKKYKKNAFKKTDYS